MSILDISIRNKNQNVILIIAHFYFIIFSYMIFGERSAKYEIT